MKSIFLSVVVIAALAIAGIGGTFAGWSDTEQSDNNTIATGSLDLKVQGTDDLPWGSGIPQLVSIEDMIPEDWYEFTIHVENQGEAVNNNGDNVSAPLYIQFKNYRCSNVDPTCGTGYEDYLVEDMMKPEPELVAEYGGILGQVHITAANASVGNWGPFNADWPAGHPEWPIRAAAMGPKGENCCMGSAIKVDMFFGPEGGTMTEVSGFPKHLEDIAGEQIYLGDLPQCGADYQITLKFQLPDIDDPSWPGDAKFADWRTNAYMLDQIMFDLEFELLDYSYVAPS